MKFYIGIDSGGTKTEVTAFDEEARLAGYGICYGHETRDKLSLDPEAKRGLGRSVETVITAIRRAIETLPKNADLYITHNLRLNTLIEALNRENIKYRSLFFIHEAQASTFASGVKEAYIENSGTGCFSYYFNEEADFYHEGLGPLLGDFGSGVYIGYASVRAAAKDEWGKEFRTSIAPRINKIITGKENNNRGRALVPYFSLLPDRNFVASFAKITNEEAEKGDLVAIEILTDAGINMGKTMKSLVTNIRPSENTPPIFYTGSVLTKIRTARESFIKYLNDSLPNEVLPLPMKLVHGSVINSYKQVNPESDEVFYEKLLNNIQSQ